MKKQSPFWNWNITGNMKNDAFNVEKKTSVLFVSVSFIVLMLISLAWLVFYYIQRFRYWLQLHTVVVAQVVAHSTTDLKDMGSNLTGMLVIFIPYPLKIRPKSAMVWLNTIVNS